MLDTINLNQILFDSAAAGILLIITVALGKILVALEEELESNVESYAYINYHLLAIRSKLPAEFWYFARLVPILLIPFASATFFSKPASVELLAYLLSGLYQGDPDVLKMYYFVLLFGLIPSYIINTWFICVRLQIQSTVNLETSIGHSVFIRVKDWWSEVQGAWFQIISSSLWYRKVA